MDAADYSKTLLAVARRRGTGAGLEYHQADMRQLSRSWTSRFEAVLNLFTSFGFFTDRGDDIRVIAEFARVLDVGGRLVWHGASRDGVMARFLEKDWWTTSDGSVVTQHRSFDALSGILTVESRFTAKSGRDVLREHRIRLYTATKLAELFAEHGLVVEEAHSGFTRRPLDRRSSEMLLVARKQ